MTIVEDAKRLAERMTGIGRPKPKQLAGLTRDVTPRAHLFKDDGATPNNPALPLLHYPRAIALPKEFDPAAVIEALFAGHGWKDSWRATGSTIFFISIRRRMKSSGSPAAPSAFGLAAPRARSSC